ncbi:MAG: ABC transporter ATP-binding protein [Acidimicrobiia bacterium]|jgi:branched-chain amino acid transport system ATP-binding protein
MLEVRDLVAGYGRAQALWEIDLRVEDGEIVTMLGPNGAGKSTLVNAISGLIATWSGTVELDGRGLTDVPSHRVAERGIAVVPEGRRIFPEMSVADNLAVGAYNKRAREASDETLAWVHGIFPRLEERSGQPAGSLSGGEQQMLAIGRALMAKPSLLLLDEPSLGLAPIMVEAIFEVLRQINESGVSILLVEQNAIDALNLATRGYVLEEGRIVIEGASSELLENEALRKAYLGL